MAFRSLKQPASSLSMAVEKPLHGIVAMLPAAFMAGSYREFDTNMADAYTVFQGVALLPIIGPLRQYAEDGGTGYDWIKLNFLDALHDKHVKAIALVIDSEGGDIPGCFDLADLIYQCRSAKPLLAICSEMAHSAAYALASACERVSVPRTGSVGSVGVIAAHADHSRELELAGIQVTLVHNGKQKADAISTAPLSETAKASMQRDVDRVGEIFVSTVARNRGMSVQAVRATNAATYLGLAGVNIGLADAVLSPDDALLNLIGQLEQLI